MKKYIFKREEVVDEYRYIFLCGSHYGHNDANDKRNVLRKFLKEENRSYRPIILEDNFIFSKNSTRVLAYDDIHMKDLYQVEMVMNYLADNNIIIHESISTGAETGLFLSEPNAIRKTCLLIPDEMAVEESKIGAFIRLAFLGDTSMVDVITFYPGVEKNVISNNVKYWHTHFYENKIGANLKNRIVNFLNRENRKFKIEFTRKKAKVDEGFVHYNIKKQRLEVTILPRVLLLCIASIFNIEELEKSIFSAGQKTLKEYIEDIRDCLLQVFINSIEEETGADINKCSIIAKMNVSRVYISEIIGMCLYLFQAAEFIEIKKDKDFSSNKKVSITRKMVNVGDGVNQFFYQKYRDCIGVAVDKQVI